MAQLFDTTSRALEFAAAGTQMRHHVITSNIANADTPKYKSLDLDFQQTLRTALNEERPTPPSNAIGRFQQLENKSFALEVKMTHQKEAEQTRNRFGMHLLAEPTTEERLDRNNVDVDKEMANRKFRVLKNAISGRV